MLSDVAIRSAKPDRERTIKLSDGGGLQLWVTPAGSKLWRVAYRFEGKQKKLSLGTYPAIGLKAAREERDEAKRHLAAGVDPSQQKRADRHRKANADANTFGVIADELLAKKRREERTEATLEKAGWHRLRAASARHATDHRHHSARDSRGAPAGRGPRQA